MTEIKVDKKGKHFQVLSPGKTNLTLNDVSIRTKGVYYELKIDRYGISGSSVKPENNILDPRITHTNANEVRVYFYNTETKDLEQGAFTISLDLETVVTEPTEEEIRLADRTRRRKAQELRKSKNKIVTSILSTDILAPADPVEPSTPSTPAPADPTKPETPSTPAPVDPVKPSTPSTPAPADPTKPETPSNPATPTELTVTTESTIVLLTDEKLRLENRRVRRKAQEARKAALKNDELKNNVEQLVLSPENNEIGLKNNTKPDYKQSVIQNAVSKRSVENNTPEITSELLSKMFFNRI